MNRIAVLADIHSNVLALERVLADIDKREIDIVVNLGDTLYGPMKPQETFLILQDRQVISILGNQDRLILEAGNNEKAANPTLKYVTEALSPGAFEWLSGLPETKTIKEEIVLCHGSPADDTAYLLEDISSGNPQLKNDDELLKGLKGIGHPVVLCAHTHIPRTVALTNGQIIVNPGSVGLPAYSDEEPIRHKMETGSPHASYALLEKRDKTWKVEHVKVPYPYMNAAEQAKKQNREDWAYSIRTGRVQ